MNDLADRILRVLQFYNCDYLFWRVGKNENREDKNLYFFINCNDLFCWGCSDLEEITDKNIDLLESTLKELNSDHGCLLFCARSRKMRPQKPYYKHFNEEEAKLFDACGKERSE